jgi:hypothetical protein
VRADFTSSNLKGWMMASIFFIGYFRCGGAFYERAAWMIQ